MKLNIVSLDGVINNLGTFTRMNTEWNIDSFFFLEIWNQKGFCGSASDYLDGRGLFCMVGIGLHITGL